MTFAKKNEARTTTPLSPLSSPNELPNDLSRRQRKVGMIIHKALSDILMNEGFKVRISEVILSKDLRYADIYFVPHSPEIKGQETKEPKTKGQEETNNITLKTLKANQTRIKQKLAGRLYLKYMPQIRFREDTHFLAAQKLDEIFN